MNYVIGCDVGSQSTKAVLLSFDAVLLGEASVDYAIDYPRPAWAEQPVERWTTALTGAVRRLLAETGVRAAQVCGIGLASQVEGVVPLDAAGAIYTPRMTEADRREILERWQAALAAVRRFHGLTENSALWTTCTTSP
jgi:xylulokinase